MFFCPHCTHISEKIFRNKNRPDRFNFSIANKVILMQHVGQNSCFNYFFCKECYVCSIPAAQNFSKARTLMWMPSRSLREIYAVSCVVPRLESVSASSDKRFCKAPTWTQLQTQTYSSCYFRIHLFKMWKLICKQ